MQLYQLISRKLSGRALDQIALSMGYSTHRLPAATARIQAVSSSETLALETSAYDYRYSGQEFVAKLCEQLSIDASFAAAEIARISAQLSARKLAFPGFLFVETYFRRTSQPIFVLAALESRRRIYIEAAIRDLALEDQIPRLKPIIEQHYQQHAGLLPLWGRIAEYKYVYAKDRQLIFDTTGKLVEESQRCLSSQASLSFS